jgi:hypothetical protein
MCSFEDCLYCAKVLEQSEISIEALEAVWAEEDKITEHPPTWENPRGFKFNG